MYNLERAFEVDGNGLLFESGAGQISGSELPLEIVMPDPCYYFRTNGEIWYNTGGGAWMLVIANVTTTVFNNTGSTIPKLSVVYINGGQGDMPTVALAQANSEEASALTYAVVVTDILNGEVGQVMVAGRLTQVNTDQFNPTAPSGDVNGTILWLDPAVAGGVTTTKPVAPNHLVKIGVIVRTHVNEGVVEVGIQNGYEISELHDVLITGPNNGQVLMYNNSTSVWENKTLTKSDVGLGNVDNTSDLDKPISTATQAALDLKADQADLDTLQGQVDTNEVVVDDLLSDTSEPTGHVDRTQSTISWDDGNRTLTISAVSGSFEVYTGGIKQTISGSLTKQIPDTTGTYFFYITQNGVLDYATAFSTAILRLYAYTAYVYWNATDGQAIVFGEERHGIVMDGITHGYLHQSVGTVLLTGGQISYTVGDGSVSGHAAIGIGDMRVSDEDISINITHADTPTNNHEQILFPTAHIPVYYQSGTAWTKDTATIYPMKQGTTRARYNQLSGGTWSTVDASQDGKYLATFIFATTNIVEPVIAILGQAEYTDQADAETNASWANIVFNLLPAQEMKLLYILIYETSSAFANTPKCAIKVVKDVRYGGDRAVSAYSLNTAHSQLSGLQNDDHLLYLTELRGDARYYTETEVDTFLSGKQDSGDYITALTGDVTATGPTGGGSASAALSLTGVSAGTYNIVTVDTKGRVTAGSSGSTAKYSYFTNAAVATTSATYTSVGSLTSVSLGVGLYKFRFTGLMQSAAANTGVGVRVAPVTATVTTCFGEWRIKQAANGTAAIFVYDQLDQTTNVTSASVQTANTNFVVTGEGVFRVTVAGTVAIQTRTETAGTAATLAIDSVFIIDIA